MSTRYRDLFSLLLFLLFLLCPGRPVGAGAFAATPSEESRLVEALRQRGVVILIRHSATDPGVGDPPGFKLSDCSTQRNLNDAGREQARRLGNWFKVHGIVPTAVWVSPWCRTRETAMLAFGRSQDWVALSNLLGDRSRQDEHARQVRDAIAAVGADKVDVLVSHGVSINAFIDVYLQQGEMVAVRPVPAASTTASTTSAATGRIGTGGIEVLGRWLVP